MQIVKGFFTKKNLKCYDPTVRKWDQLYRYRVGSGLKWPHTLPLVLEQLLMLLGDEDWPRAALSPACAYPDIREAFRWRSTSWVVPSW